MRPSNTQDCSRHPNWHCAIARGQSARHKEGLSPCKPRNGLPPGMDAAVAAFERWCRVRLLAALQQAGLLAAPGARITAEDVLALHPVQLASHIALSADSRHGAAAGSESSQAHGSPAAGHQRMVAALLETLRDAGFLEAAAAAEGGAPAFVAAAAVAGAGVRAEVAALGADAARLCAGDGAALAANVALVDACLGALPGILTGAPACPARPSLHPQHVQDPPIARSVMTGLLRSKSTVGLGACQGGQGRQVVVVP